MADGTKLVISLGYYRFIVSRELATQFLALMLGEDAEIYDTKYENGKSKISPIMLLQFGYFFGKSGGELFSEAEKQYYKNQIN